MTSNARKLIFALLLLTCPFGTWSGGDAWAYNEAEADKVAADMKKYGYKSVMSKNGLNFSVPEDMPIETKGGITAPVPYTDYLYYKFKKLEEKFIAAEKRIAELEKNQAAAEKKARDLELRIKRLDNRSRVAPVPLPDPPPQEEPQTT